jgi:hypothetical protein
MRFYVANVTKQNHIFVYRVPERSQAITQLIPIGAQICLAPNGSNTDLTPEEIDAVLKQHGRYGMRDASNLGASIDPDHKDAPFSGIVYSIGKAVSPEKLEKASIRHEQGLDKLGKQIRQEAALAAQHSFEKKILGGDQMPNPFDVSVEEVVPSNGLDEKLTHISEGVRINRNAPERVMSPIDVSRR